MSKVAFEKQTKTNAERENEPRPERVSVTMLNTSFGDALKDEDTLARLLPPEGADGLAVVGFSEVTPGVRAASVEAIEQQGYTAVIPNGEGENIDIIWAVSSGLQIKHSIAHRFTGKLESRPGKRQKRDAGTLIIDAVTPEGHVLRLSTQRFAPPMRGAKARERHLVDMAAVFDDLSQANDTMVDVDISGGDHNHANGPKETDQKLWEGRGFKPVVKDGEATYDLKAAGRVARALGKTLTILGRYPSMEFDKMYINEGEGRQLLELGADGEDVSLSPNQIGYTPAEVIPVSGTDHHAIKTIISFQ